MTTFLSIQNTYNTIEIALFNDSQLIDWVTEDKISASKNCIPLMQQLLIKHGTNLKNLSFIAVNQGPGPFTTLRVVIATVNGLSFANNIPLIGIDALDGLLTEYQSPEYSITVALLNAFNNDVYFGIQQTEHEIEKGYKNITQLLQELTVRFSGNTVRFIGNGAGLFSDAIKNSFGSNAIIPEPLPQTCTVQQIGLLAFEQWQAQHAGSSELQPLYLKQISL